MSDQSKRLSRHSTISLVAAFIPDDAEEQPDMAELVGNLGVGMLRLPGVLVQAGGPSPGYPFVEIGEFEQDHDVGAQGLSRDGMSTSSAYSGDDESHPGSQHSRHAARPARGRPHDRASVNVVTDPQTDRPVAPFPGSQESQCVGDMHDVAIAAALLAATTQPSYAELSDLVRHAVPSCTRSPGEDATNLSEDIPDAEPA